MVASREDFLRRSAANLVRLSDPTLRSVGNSVFAHVTPLTTQRETYGIADTVLAASAVFLQLADLAYSVWDSNSGRSKVDEVQAALTTAALAMAEVVERDRVSEKHREEMICALLDALRDEQVEHGDNDPGTSRRRPAQHSRRGRQP